MLFADDNEIVHRRGGVRSYNFTRVQSVFSNFDSI